MYVRAESDSGGTVTTTPSSYFYTRDHLGSIREMTDSAGALVARYEYDPFGRRSANLITSGAVEADFGYTGHYFHAPSGLHLAVYRAYDADTGRWLNRDPLGEAGGINLYQYVANNPLGSTDLLGLQGNFDFNTSHSEAIIPYPYTGTLPQLVSPNDLVNPPPSFINQAIAGMFPDYPQQFQESLMEIENRLRGAPFVDVGLGCWESITRHNFFHPDQDVPYYMLRDSGLDLLYSYLALFNSIMLDVPGYEMPLVDPVQKFGEKFEKWYPNPNDDWREEHPSLSPALDFRH